MASVRDWRPGEPKVTNEQKAMIRNLYAKGADRNWLASQYGVSYASIYAYTRDVEPPPAPVLAPEASAACSAAEAENAAKIHDIYRYLLLLLRAPEGTPWPSACEMGVRIMEIIARGEEGTEH